MSVPAGLRRGVKAVAAGCFALLVSACSTTGNNFDTSGMYLLEPGVTTMDQASALMHAEPTNVYRQLSGAATARWAHKATLATDAVYFNRELWLAFDANGRYTHIVKSVNIPRAHEFGNRQPVPLAGPPPQPQPAAAKSAQADTGGALYKPAITYPLPPQ